MKKMSSGGDVGASEPVPSKPRLQSPLDYRNGDLVSRLLAATPPYLYNMPLVPHSFFFSEMLRSFVQAKAETPQPRAGVAPRRSRKRAWRDVSKPPPPPPPPPAADKPLELTTTPRQPEEKPSSPPPALPPPPLLLPPCGLLPLPSPDTTLPPDMLLPPPPPPLWYPPLYPLPPQPPYGIDPLHFFIDLRVSGHIWDRKMGKDSSVEDKPALPTRPPSASSSSGGSAAPSLVKQTKHCSAFSVPQPRVASDPVPTSEHVPSPTSTHYVLQNLGRIYQDVRRDADAESDTEGGEGKPRCKDLRALIGLELVVDYVKHEGGPKRRSETPEGSPPLEVEALPSPPPPLEHEQQLGALRPC